jgi:Ni,Fe-hydrogenase maturation factor
VPIDRRTVGSDPDTGSARVLVIGYGNTLRRDDGVGVRVAEAVAADPRFAHVRVLAVHQLTPELALDIGSASLVIFVDADVRGLPGSIEVHDLGGGERAGGGGTKAETAAEKLAAGEPAAGVAAGSTARSAGVGPPSGRPAESTSSHHVGADELLALARELVGATPRAVAVGIGVADLELGEELSDPVEAAVPRALEVLADLIEVRHRA